MDQLVQFITNRLEAMVSAADHALIHAKRKAISTLFMYIILEEGKPQQMVDAISRVVGSPGTRWSVWPHIGPCTSMLFSRSNSPSVDSAIVLLSPYIGWDEELRSEADVVRWAAATLAVPYTEEVGRYAASALVQIACWFNLLPHIPIEIWTWLKKHSTILPPYQGPYITISAEAVRYLQRLGDVDIIKSYLLLAWSEGCDIDDVYWIRDSFRVDFCGIGMWGYREDLIKRLDKVLEDCDQGYDPPGWLPRKSDEYQILREGLLKIETEATKTLIGTPLKLSLSANILILPRTWICTESRSMFACSLPLPCP